MTPTNPKPLTAAERAELKRVAEAGVQGGVMLPQWVKDLEADARCQIDMKPAQVMKEMGADAQRKLVEAGEAMRKRFVNRMEKHHDASICGCMLCVGDREAVAAWTAAKKEAGLK